MQYLAEELHRVSQEERAAKQQRDELKKELFKLIDVDFKNNPHLLPVRQIEVPQSFFDKTGMTYDEFISSRYPGWTCEHVEKDISSDRLVFIVKRDATCMPYSIEINNGEFRVSREINEYTPSVDWNSMRDELPELFDRLAAPHITYEINEDELERLIEIEPDVLSKLQRHMKVKEPSLKVTSRKVKSDE